MATLQELFGDNAELTASIQTVDFTPGLIAAGKIFTEGGIATTKMFIEYDGDVITLVPSAPRGGVGEPFPTGRGSGIEVSAVHLPTRGSVMADEVQNQRAFGGTDLDSPEALRDRKLSIMRNNLEATIEWLRLGALKGLVLDADGETVIADLYAEFGITQTTKALALATPGTRLLTKIIDAEREAEDALGGVVPSGFLAYAAPDFMDMLRLHPDYEMYLEQARPSDLVKNYRNAITIGATTFVEYRTPRNSNERIAEGQAIMFPLGVPNMFITKFAPADWVETVNRPGLPIYAKAEPMSFGRGYELSAQSNPVSVCTRPAAVLKLTA